MTLEGYVPPCLLRDDQHRVNIYSCRSSGLHAIERCRASGQERSEQGRRYEPEFLTCAKLTLVNRGDRGSVIDPVDEMREIPDVAGAIGMREDDEAGSYTCGSEVGSRLNGRGDLFATVGFQGPNALTKFRQGDGGIDTGPGGAVRIDDGGSGAEFAEVDHLADLAKGFPSQLLHVAGDVILVHESGLAGQLEEYGVLLQGNRYVGVADRLGRRNSTLCEQEARSGDGGDAVGSHVVRVNPTEDDGIGLVEGLFFLHPERSEDHVGFCMLEHFEFGSNQVPGGNK